MASLRIRTLVGWIRLRKQGRQHEIILEGLGNTGDPVATVHRWERLQLWEVRRCPSLYRNSLNNWVNWLDSQDGRGHLLKENVTSLRAALLLIASEIDTSEISRAPRHRKPDLSELSAGYMREFNGTCGAQHAAPESAAFPKRLNDTALIVPADPLAQPFRVPATQLARYDLEAERTALLARGGSR